MLFLPDPPRPARFAPGRPRTCADWLECVQLLAGQLKPTWVAKDGYLCNWVCRTFCLSARRALKPAAARPSPPLQFAIRLTSSRQLLPARVEMRAKGVTGLTLVGRGELAAAEQVAVYARSVPDEGGWLVKFGDFFQVETLEALCRELQYSGPPELLSMRCCLYLVLPDLPARSSVVCSVGCLLA